jgi:hypothetical protein
LRAFVIDRHRRQVEVFDGVGRQAQADHAAAFADQERHRFNGQVLSGDNQAGFVLAVEIGEQDVK